MEKKEKKERRKERKKAALNIVGDLSIRNVDSRKLPTYDVHGIKRVLKNPKGKFKNKKSYPGLKNGKFFKRGHS